MAEYAVAKEVQRRLHDYLQGKARLAGIGLVESGDGFAVVINLIDPGEATIPDRIDDVEIRIRHVEPPSAR